MVGYKAVAQADHNPQNTVYDAKRFIGKHFTKEELVAERARYPFKVSVIDFKEKLMQHLCLSGLHSIQIHLKA